jgi:hypothetical protein
MFSSTPIPVPTKDASTIQLQSSERVLQMAKAFLKTCASKNYYIINEPRLTASSISKSLPYLQDAMLHDSVKSSLLVPEVLGLSDGMRQEIIEFLKENCGAKVSQKFVDDGKYGARDSATMNDEILIGGWTESEQKLGQSDPALQLNVLKNMRKYHDYTFILFSTASGVVEEDNESTIYQAAFDDPLHMDLKRDIYARDGNATKRFDGRPLFEKYQFLTPGLFMSLLVGLILLSILGVGIRAISSLEVSYGAFEKEMGPTAHKKQQ